MLQLLCGRQVEGYWSAGRHGSARCRVCGCYIKSATTTVGVEASSSAAMATGS